MSSNFHWSHAIGQHRGLFRGLEVGWRLWFRWLILQHLWLFLLFWICVLDWYHHFMWCVMHCDSFHSSQLSYLFIMSMYSFELVNHPPQISNPELPMSASYLSFQLGQVRCVLHIASSELIISWYHPKLLDKTCSNLPHVPRQCLTYIYIYIYYIHITLFTCILSLPREFHSFTIPWLTWRIALKCWPHQLIPL